MIAGTKEGRTSDSNKANQQCLCYILVSEEDILSSLLRIVGLGGDQHSSVAFDIARSQNRFKEEESLDMLQQMLQRFLDPLVRIS